MGLRRIGRMSADDGWRDCLRHPWRCGLGARRMNQWQAGPLAVTGIFDIVRMVLMLGFRGSYRGWTFRAERPATSMQSRPAMRAWEIVQSDRAQIAYDGYSSAARASMFVPEGE